MQLLQESNQKIRELRRALEELRIDKDASDAKANRVKQLEDLVAELKQANRSLEDKIARLCEAPFISDAFGQHEAKSRFEDLLRERDTLSGQISHLQEAVRTNFSALNTLKQQAAQLREEKDTLKKLNDELLVKLQKLESGTSELSSKLKLYGGEDGLDVESLERALTIVKRRSGAVDKLPFLEAVDDESLSSLPSIKRKLEDYQLLNLRLSEENERLENMLKLQSSINQDLHKELGTLIRGRDKEKSNLVQKTKDFEELAVQRLDKIHKLEAQLREFMYGLGKSTKGGPIGVDKQAESSPASLQDSDDGSGLLSQLLMEKGEIEADENLVEIWMKRATFVDGVLPPSSSTFAVVDFFDYESQATPVIVGNNPNWDFAATYKIKVDDFFLRYLATDSLSIDLNMVNLYFLHRLPSQL